MILRKHEEYCNSDFTLHILRREKQLLISCWPEASRKSKEGERKSHLEISFLLVLWNYVAYSYCESWQCKIMRQTLQEKQRNVVLQCFFILFFFFFDLIDKMAYHLSFSYWFSCCLTIHIDYSIEVLMKKTLKMTSQG